MTDDLTPSASDGLSLVDPGDFRNRSGRTQAPLSVVQAPRTQVVVHFGQSMQGNFAESGQYGNGYYVQQYPINCFSFDFWNGGVYYMKDPALGGGFDSVSVPFAGRGSAANWIADQAIAAGKCSNYLDVNAVVGGTPVEYWTPGGQLWPRVTTVLARLTEAGLAPTLIMMDIGQEDAGVYGTSANAFITYMRQFANGLRALGVTCPIVTGTGVCWPGTVTTGSGPWTSVRTGQLLWLNSSQVPAVPVPVNCQVGPDEDTLAPYPYRVGGVAGNPNIGEPHWNAAGCAAAAALWLPFIPTL